MKDEKCTVKNEKLIFRILLFVVFELWSKFLDYFDKWLNFVFVPGGAQHSETDLYILLTVVRFLV